MMLLFQSLSKYLLKICFYLNREGKRKLPSAYSFPKCLQPLGLGQTKDRSQELGFPHGWQECRPLSHPLLHPTECISRKLDLEAELLPELRHCYVGRGIPSNVAKDLSWHYHFCLFYQLFYRKLLWLCFKTWTPKDRTSYLLEWLSFIYLASMTEIGEATTTGEAGTWNSSKPLSFVP